MSATQSPKLLSLAIDNTRSPIRLVNYRVLKGCNVYHTSTVFRQRINLGKLAGRRTNEADSGFATRFADRFLGPLELTPAGPMSESFLRRLREPDGVLFEEALFAAILAVESSIAFVMRNLDVPGYAQMFPTQLPGVVDLVWECTAVKISRRAAVAGSRGLTELLPDGLRPTEADDGRDFSMLMTRLRKVGKRRRRSLSAAALALAAKRRRLPCTILGRSYLRLGQGFVQHIIHPSFSGHTTVRADDLQRFAGPGQRVLTENGLPRPQQRTVTNADDARRAADELSYPVALKPLKGRRIPGTTVWAGSIDDIATAFASARRDGRAVLVEEHVAGQSHRILIIDNRFVAACRIDPPVITGDGRKSVMQLIEALNEDPQRNGVRQAKVSVNNELEQTFALAGYTLDDVPGDGVAITVQCASSFTTGATCTDVTDQVHPDNREVAVRAVEAAGLKVADVEFVMPDITHSFKHAGGRIVEVHQRPELAMYAWPRHGTPRDVGKAILELAFPGEQTGRIPIIMVAGSHGRDRVAGDAEYLLRSSGLTVGLAQRKISTMSGWPVPLGESRPQDAAQFLLHDPRAELVIGVATPRSIVKHGLRLDRCDVAAILSPVKGEDIDGYQRGLMVLLRATTGCIVVSADNGAALELMTRIALSDIVLLSMHQDDRSIQRHLAAGGCAIFRNRRKNLDQIVFKRAGKRLVSVPVSSLVTSRTSRVSTRRIRERMYALALAYGVGLSGRGLEAVATTRPAVNQTA